MYHSSATIPEARDITVEMWRARDGRIRVIRIGGATDGATVHVSDRSVLDALQAALDEIRADMDAAAVEDAQVVPAYWDSTVRGTVT